MKKVLFIAIAAIIDIPEEDSVIGAPLRTGPLDQTAERLHSEASHGRDHSRPDFDLPGVTAWMAAAYQECPNSN